MVIPESQLSQWSSHGSQTSSKQTHEAIRTALKFHTWPDGVTYDFFLQGSYSNDTNIRGDSDVDVILKLNHTFHYECNMLSLDDQAKLKKLFQSPTYKWNNFRRDALTALNDNFSTSVNQGNKSIKLREDPPRLAADIVVCIEYRKYNSLTSFVKGITFYAMHDRRWIVNYPRKHYKNGVMKNSRTKNRYKRTVRMLKNARNHLVDTKKITDDLAPSYFLECLIYNAPNDAFKDGLQDTYYSIVNWLYRADISKAVCQNNQLYLFGPSAEQWSLENAKILSDQLTTLWNNWN